MDKVWERIEAWLRRHAPEILADLRPGASEADVKKAAQTFRSELPADLVASYRIHDGTRGGAPPLLGKWRLLSLAASAREWKTLKKLHDDGTFEGMEGDPDPQIKDGWWNPGWIPVASNGSGDFLCADLDPERGGRKGQIVSFLHADPGRRLVAKDFEAWLTGFAADLEAGRFRVDQDGWLTEVA